MYTALVLLFLLLGLDFSTAAREVATIKALKPHGVLFELAGKVWLAQDTAIILTKIPSINWDPALKFLNSSESAIDELCEQRSRFEGFLSDSCHHWHEEFENAKREVTEQLSRLREWTVHSRKKRGLVNVIGQFSKFLFGTMDDSDAQDIYTRLQTLEDHDGESLQVLKNGMAIIQSNADFLRTVVENITENEKVIQERMNHFQALLSSEVKYLSKNLRAINIQSEINQVVLFLIAKLTQINKYLSDHFSILTSLQQNKLHPLVVSTTELMKAVLEMQSAPLSPLMSDSIILERVARVNTLSLQNDIIVQIEIPLILKNEYNLNKVYPLPSLVSSSSYNILELPEGFVLNNSEAGHLIEMSEREFQHQCENLKSNTDPPVYLCHHTVPIHVGPEPENCLLNLFHNPNSSPSECPLRVGKTFPNKLIKMTHLNTWLFMTEKERTLRARCQSEIHSIILKDIGILTLLQPCSFQVENIALPFTRRGTKVLEIHQPTVYVPLLNTNRTVLNALESLPEPIFNTNLTQPIKISHPSGLKEFFRLNTKSIQEVQQDITRLEAKRQMEKQSKALRIQNFISLPLISILVLGLALFSVLRFSKRCKNQSHNSPAIPLQTIVSINTQEKQPQTSTDKQEGKSPSIQAKTVKLDELPQKSKREFTTIDDVITIH